MHCHRFLLDGERRGGFGHDCTGRFYRAHDTPLDRHVAVKVLPAPELGTQGRLRLDWAEAHVARGEPGDREQAEELLREAQAAFEEMGIPRYATVAQQRLDELEAE